VESWADVDAINADWDVTGTIELIAEGVTGQANSALTLQNRALEGVFHAEMMFGVPEVPTVDGMVGFAVMTSPSTHVLSVTCSWTSAPTVVWSVSSVDTAFDLTVTDPLEPKLVIVEWNTLDQWRIVVGSDVFSGSGDGTAGFSVAQVTTDGEGYVGVLSTACDITNSLWYWETQDGGLFQTQSGLPWEMQ